MPDVEAVGDAVTGGLVARAVEPGAGEAAPRQTQERNCLNCGCRLVGAYCHCCGQRGRVHRTIAAWWHDFLHSVLHLDGKFWRTLPMLVWRPGELTRRYAHGERAKFISPLALFLFTVFLMFALFTVAGPSAGGDFAITETVEEGLAEEREKLALLESQRADATGPAASDLDRRIAETRDDIAGLEELRRSGVTHAPITGVGEPPEGDVLFRSVYKKATENPQLLMYKLQANAYKFSWALIPISVPFVWLLFQHRRRYRREFTAYDHLVFVTYSISFMSLALVSFFLLHALGLGGDALSLAFMLIAPLHMYRQLRGAYGVSPAGALWRTLALLTFASIALTLFLMLLLLLGGLG